MRPTPFAGLAVGLALLVAGGCTRPAGIDQFKQLRTYGWDVPVADPQVDPNPITHQIVVRSVNGFGVLDEGSGKQAFFRAQSGRDSWYPAWTSDEQFIVGGQHNVEKLADGRIVPPTEGLTVITLRADGSVRERQLARVGFRPRVWKKRIVAQIENKMWLFDADGESEDYGEGFMPVPQRAGDGLAYQETPVIEPDYWTAKPVRSRLFVQWGRGRVSAIPGAIEPSWTATGGVIAARLKADPPKDGPWWEAGTELVLLGGQGHQVEVLGDDLREPAAHPHQPVAAAVTRDGRLVLVDLRDKRQREIAPVGSHPCWSADGTRLYAEEPVLDKKNASYVRAYVFKVEEPKK